MQLLSLTGRFGAAKTQPADLLRFLCLILEGIVVHAVEGDSDDLVQFRNEITSYSDRLTLQTNPDEFLVTIGAVLHSLDGYNRRASQFSKSRTSELHNALGLMTETIGCLASSSQIEIQNLRSIERDLEKASVIEDIRTLRGKLAGCLTALKNESTRVQVDSQERIQSLKAGVQRAAENLQVLPIDSETGLPGRGSAEQAIANHIAAGEHAGVALFVLDRLMSINGRFGRSIGDQVLMAFAQHLAQQLPGNNTLWRWSGPAFLAILPASANLDRDVQQIANARLEKSVHADGRSLLLPISCSWTVEKLNSSASAEAIFRKLDGFVAARCGSSGGHGSS